jgi:basic amino acid/polyamine antiporter, APA family
VSAPVRTEPASSGAEPRLFTRNATGLVRDLSGKQQVIWNWIAGAPPLGLAFGVFVGLSAFPGGNVYVGMLLVVPMALAFCYAFGLLTSAMPRSGGDYTLVSRTMHPAIGLAGSLCMVLAQALGIALIGGLLFVSLGVSSSLATLGLVSGNATLLEWSATVATSKGWQFAIGAAVMILGGALVALGWRATKRLMFGLLAFSLFGLLVSVLVALFTSRSEFASAFDDFAAPLTGAGGAYEGTIATATEAGLDPSPPFSFSNSLPMTAIFASFGIYAYITSYVGGELREGSSIRTAHRMAAAALLGIGSMAVFIAIFFRSWGSDFVTAAYGGGLPAELGITPTYFVLTSIQLDSTVFAVFQCLAFLAFPPVLVAYLLVMISRIMFAWSFDGLLPARVATVSRHNAPVVAIAIATAVALLFYVWVVFAADNLGQVVAITTMMQLIPMALVGLAAVLIPRLRPQLYRAAATTRTVAGVPVVAIAGAASLISAAVLYYLYFDEEYFGLGDPGTFFALAFGTVAAGVIWYVAAKAVRRREGVDLDLVYKELPAE